MALVPNLGSVRRSSDSASRRFFICWVFTFVPDRRRIGVILFERERGLECELCSEGLIVGFVIGLLREWAGNLLIESRYLDKVITSLT